jgi:predicted RNA-binding protein with PIN domain
VNQPRSPSGRSGGEPSGPPDAVLVDGYNLLHAIPRFAPRGADLASARAQLEQWLAEAARRRGVREVILVWDGGGAAPPDPTRARPPLEVVFTPANKTADERLLALCRGRYAAMGDRTWVVSSDRDVQAPARELGFETMGAMTFFRRWSDARPRGGCAREAEPEKPRATRHEVDELLERFLADGGQPGGDDTLAEDAS